MIFSASKSPLIALFGLGLLSAAPALAADDGQEGLFDSILGIVGVGDKKAPEIDYRDRAPLVLPPKMALRQPLPSGAQRPAAWPNDPDVARRAREAAPQPVLRKPAATPLIEMWMPVCTRAFSGSPSLRCR